MDFSSLKDVIADPGRQEDFERFQEMAEQTPEARQGRIAVVRGRDHQERRGRDLCAMLQEVGGIEKGQRIGAQSFENLPQGFELRQLLAALVFGLRSEEHTSELQSLAYLVCR